MKSYFDSKSKFDCNGCGVCALKCPTNAITMIEDYEGFLYPEIDEKKCIHCGLCRKKCSNVVKNVDCVQNTYIAINKNVDDRLSSTSGGIFILLARYVIEKCGIVFGAIYDENLVVKHIGISNLDELHKFQGSKYVRSDLNFSFDCVKENLLKKRLVLFSGTPCQCQSLKVYLGKDFENLITCEIICHANPSPKIFEMYKENLELINGKKIKEIRFRSKENGWKNSQTVIIFNDDTKIIDNSYQNAFLDELINRPSCNYCRFSNIVRLSDFTIGDMWGIDEINPKMNNDNIGISLLNVNTDKANRILNELYDKLILEKVDTTLAFSYNHHCNVKINKKRKKFFKHVLDKKITSNNIICNFNKYTYVNIFVRVIRKFKRVINI